MTATDIRPEQQEGGDTIEAELASYHEVFDTVRSWRPELQADLAQAILSLLAEGVGSPKRRNSYERIAGRLKTNKPAPTDKEVREMLEQARLERYG